MDDFFREVIDYSCELSPVTETLNKKQIRDLFREKVLKRDENKCVVCGYYPKDPYYLDVHHITDRSLMPNGGYCSENGITLCCDRSKIDNCHMKAEMFHATGNVVLGYSIENLYVRISSSYDFAFRQSLKLSLYENEVENLMVAIRKTSQQEELILKTLQSGPNETTWELACDVLNEENFFIKNYAKGRYVDLSHRRTEKPN